VLNAAVALVLAAVVTEVAISSVVIVTMVAILPALILGILIEEDTSEAQTPMHPDTNKFTAIHSDLDGRISFNETVQWLTNTAPVRSKRSAASDGKDRQAIDLEFKKMDTNNNNFIETNEFDHSLA